MPKQITKIVYTFEELLKVEETDICISSTCVEKARTYLIGLASMSDWYDDIYELWEKALDEIGFEDAKIAFTGFWSQGDGASFTAGVDLEKMAKYLATEIEGKDHISLDANGKETFAAYLTHKIGGKPATNPKHSRIVWLANLVDISVQRGHLRYSHEMSCSVQHGLDDEGTVFIRDEAGKLLPPEQQGWRSRTPRVRALWENFAVDVEILRKDVSRAIYRALTTCYEELTADKALIDLSNDVDITFDTAGRADG